MVTFELKEKNEGQLLYYYYPEGDKNKHPGTIVYDRIKKELFIKDLAEGDWVREVSAEELNRMAKAINKMVVERGGTDCCKYTTDSSSYAFYGNHAMSRISEAIGTGRIPEKGTAMWY